MYLFKVDHNNWCPFLAFEYLPYLQYSTYSNRTIADELCSVKDSCYLFFHKLGNNTVGILFDCAFEAIILSACENIILSKRTKIFLFSVIY